MPSISIFILGLVMTTVIAASVSTSENTTDSELNNSTISTIVITGITNTSIPSIQIIMDDTNNTTVPATAEPTGTEKPSSPTITEAKTTTEVTPTPTPIPSGSSTSRASTTSKNTNHKTTTPHPQKGTSDKTGIIILVVLILVVSGFFIACYIAHKRRRRYSVDFSSRQDGVNIPLSTVDPEMTADTAPQNGLKTFESIETTAKEPEEPEAKPEAKPEAQEEQKAETDESAADPSAKSATLAPAPAPDSTEDKPQVDVVEQSPPAPLESTVEEKTDDDDDAPVPNKTLVESLKETNENNSNNADFSQTRNLIFWEVPLDCPV